MPENSENIEARLCAYVEGDLDEQGRVEIERHLAAHPNHRRLLSELMATRDLLRYLPREQAPPELAETFNAQLERSALLDGAGPEPSGRALRSGNFMPRLMAMAAIIVLGSGLFAIVYFSLPRGESGTQLAMPTISPDSRPVAGGVVAADEDAAPVDRTGEFAKAGTRGGAGGGADVRTERLGKGGAPRDGLADALAAKKDGWSGELNKSGRKAGALVEPVYVLVSADRIDAAVREVTSNLSDNSIVWETVTDARPLPPRLQQQQLQYQATTNSANYNNTGNNTAVAAQLELGNALHKRQRQYSAAGNLRQRPINDQVALGEDEEESKSERPAASGPTAVASAEEQGKEKAPSHAVARDKSAEATAISGGAGQQVARRTQEEQQAEQKQQVAPAAPHIVQLPADSEVIAINAYGVKRTQVEQLAGMLNRSSQRVELIADDAHLQRVNAGLQRMLNEQPPTGLAAAEKAFKADASPATSQPAALETTAIAQAPAAAATPAPAAEPAKGSAGKRDSDAVALKGRAPSASKPDSSTRPARDAQREAVADNTSAQRQDVNSKISSRAGAGPRPALIRPGAKLYVTVDELKGPDTEATTEASVADDGTVVLPQLPEPLRVNGLTRLEAAEAIADAYKAAGVIDAPNVTVEPVADDGPLADTRTKMQQRRQREIPQRDANEAEAGAVADAAAPNQQAVQQPSAPLAPDARARAAAPEAGAKPDGQVSASESDTAGAEQANHPGAAAEVAVGAGTQPQAPVGESGQAQVVEVEADADADPNEPVDVVILVQRNTAAPAQAATAPDVAASDEAAPEDPAGAPNAAASESPSDPAAAQRGDPADAAVPAPPPDPSAPTESAK